MTSRNGFALIAVLWLVAALTITVSVGLSATAGRFQTSVNRIELRRALWAARGCVAVAQFDYQQGEGEEPLRVDWIPLGQGIGCAAEPIDPELRLLVNGATREQLGAVLGNDSISDAIVDWLDADTVPGVLGAEAAWYRAFGRATPRNGPIDDLRELRFVRGLEALETEILDEALTTRGDGSVDPNRAPLVVLTAALGLDAREAVALDRFRATRTFTDAESVATALGRSPDAADFRALTGKLAFDQRQRTIEAKGVVRVGSRTLTATIVAMLVALPDRIAIRRMEVDG